MPTFSLNEWIKLLGEFYNHYGYVTVFLGTLGENTAFLGLLLPGNSLALLGAVYARLGMLNLGWVILLATLGTIFGYHIDYLLGRFVLARFATGWSTSRLGRRIRLAGRLRLARLLIAKHGGKAILISHLFGQLRSFVALSAGLTGILSKGAVAAIVPVKSGQRDEYFSRVGNDRSLPACTNRCCGVQ